MKFIEPLKVIHRLRLTLQLMLTTGSCCKTYDFIYLQTAYVVSLLSDRHYKGYINNLFVFNDLSNLRLFKKRGFFINRLKSSVYTAY